MNDFNPRDKVYLKRRYVKGGNIWYPGYYKVMELPVEVRNKTFLGDTLPASSANYSDAIKKQKISITSKKPLVEKTAYGEPLPTVVEKNKPAKSSVKPNLKVAINTASVEEMVELTYVGTATATQIVEARKESPFKDIQDLSDRVSLSRGNWQEIADNILFS